MWTNNFHYERPTTLDEAFKFMADHEDAKLIAGGHSLIPAMKLRLAEYETLIDISRLAELKGISQNNGGLRIGAMTTHTEVAASDAVKSVIPALATAAGLVGDVQVRNWGTLGGNLAHADPAADPTIVVLAVGASINLRSSDGSRTVAADDFFIDLFTVDLAENEIITSVDIPDLEGATSGYAKMRHPSSGYAVIGVCAVLNMDGSTCQSARIAIGGATVKAMRSPGAESAMAGTTLDDSALNVAADALREDIAGDLIGDVSYPEAYRQQISGAYLKRAVRAALG